jgi:O-antigen/teichoic acid export membrane protein
MSTFAKNSFWTIFSQGVIFLVGLGTSVIISRILNPEGRGIYALAVFLPAFLMYFSNLGIGLSATFYIASGKYAPKIVIGNSLVCVFVHSIFAILIGLMIICFFREKLFAGVALKYLLLALLIVPSQLYLSFILPILLGMQKIREYNFFQVIRYVLLFGLVIIFLVGLNAGVTGAIIAEALAAYITCIAAFVIVSREIKEISFKIDKGYLKDAYQYGGKLYAGFMLNFLNRRFNLILINFFMSPVMVGFFGLAAALSEKVWLIADAIGTVLFPRIASEKDEGKKTVFTSLVFKTTILIVVVIGVFLYSLGEWLIVFLYSSAFIESVRPFRFLLVGVVAGSGWRILENDLKGRGKAGLVTCIMAVSFVVNILFNIVLIPRYGMMGAAWASVVSATVSLIISIFAYCQVSGNEVHLLLLFSRSDLIVYKNLVKSFIKV